MVGCHLSSEATESESLRWAMLDTVRPNGSRGVAPRVTVFIPTFNRSELLRQAIESVLAQTYRDFRLEISDNASTDDTPSVVESFADARIVYVRQPENIGLLGNHNQILNRVASEYSLIVPDDDIIYPELLEKAIRILDENPRVGVIHASFDVIGPAGEVVLRDQNWTGGLMDDTIETSDEFIERSMIWGCRICQSTALTRRVALPTRAMIGDDDANPFDFSLWLRTAAGGWQFAFIRETLGAVRMHGATHSAGTGAFSGPGYIFYDETIAALRDFKQRYIDAYTSNPRRARRLKKLARKGYHLDLVARARRHTLPQRNLLPTLRALRHEMRLAPGVALEPAAWRLLVGSVLGRRMVERLVGRDPTTELGRTESS
jgi:glycosyltransferase involved in cell wall biosynthesis